MSEQSTDINNFLDVYIQNVQEEMYEQPSSLTSDEVKSCNITKNYDDLIFYTTLNEGENKALYLEQQIVVGLALIHSITDDEVTADSTQNADLICKILVYIWAEIIAFSAEHREKTVYFSNTYLHNIEQHIIDTAYILADKINKTSPLITEHITGDELLHINLSTFDKLSETWSYTAELFTKTTDKNSLN